VGRWILAPSTKGQGPNGLTIKHRLALRGKNVAELRELASRFLTIDASGISAPQLIEELSTEARTNVALSNELGKSPIAIKPSFYLMVATLGKSRAQVDRDRGIAGGLASNHALLED
jgi:hypothetical protein